MNDLIYLAMSGAKALAQRQEAVAHNLANADTSGFRAGLAAFRAVPLEASGTAPTRVFNLEAGVGFDATPGPVRITERTLDVAIAGPGWFAIQTEDGGEGYTRNGRFELGPEGLLQLPGGRPVLGQGGPLMIPPDAEVTIGADGTVSARSGTQPPEQVGRLRLVNPPPGALERGNDGLMRSAAGDPPAEDLDVRVVAGALEGSNVAVVDAMVGMIALSRQFEVQMRLLQTAENNEQRAAQLLSTTS